LDELEDMHFMQA
jgi:Protein kinase domain